MIQLNIVYSFINISFYNIIILKFQIIDDNVIL